jgi:PKD repeat protein
VKYSSIKSFFKRKSVWAAVYAVYLAIILMSVQAFIAVDIKQDIINNMDKSYTYHLTFKETGTVTHYDVVLHNESQYGYIDLTYWTADNILDITNIKNIKELSIDVNSMFEDESERVFKKLPGDISTMDMDYWFVAGDGIFVIKFNIGESEPLEKLTFNEFPTPTSVLVDNQEWWDTSTNYSFSGSSIIITNVPAGKLTTVTIDFNLANLLPKALFTMNPESFANVNQQVTFDASGSTDDDGSIVSWVWDFGDGDQDSGEKDITHKYAKPGMYTINLTVRDDDDAVAVASKTINVDYGAQDDNDDDGLFDKWEFDNFGDLGQTKTGDPDNDGYENGLEQTAQTDPNDGGSYNEDYDSDQLPDPWEWAYFETIAWGPNDDPDNDSATNKEEYEAETFPNDASSVPDVVTPPDDDGDDDKGMLGLGKLGGIDTLIILIIIIVVIVIAIFGVVTRSKKSKELAEKEAAMMAMHERVPAGAPPVVRGPPADFGEEPLPVRGPPEPEPPAEPGAVVTPPPEYEEPARVEAAPPMPPGLPPGVEYGAAAPAAAAEEAPVEEMTKDETIQSFAAELDIGLAEAGLLYDSGYTTYEDIDAALEEELAMIDEIGPETAERIKNNLQFVERVEVAPEELPLPSPMREPAVMRAPFGEQPAFGAPAVEPPAAEEEVMDEAEGMMECPVCGEPVEPGTTNCPVCDSPI